MLRRQLRSLVQEIHGKNGMSMDRILMIGHNVVGEGGIMKCEHDATLRLKSVIVQTKEMGEYAKIYNDFIILDGTHGTNKYRLIVMPATVIDCLGKSVISGIGICEAETKRFSAMLLEKCGLLGGIGSTLMTDEGSGFNDLGNQLNMNHMLCAHHFQKKTKNVKGLVGLEGQNVKKNWYKLIFTNFKSEEEWEDCFKSVYATLNIQDRSHVTSFKFMQGLYIARKRVCCFYTQNIFRWRRCFSSSSIHSKIVLLSLNSVIQLISLPYVI